MATLLRVIKHRPLASASVGAVGIVCSWKGFRYSTCSQPPTTSNIHSLVGRHALVVGGTSGIGHGIALSLAKAGCSVTISGRSQSRGSAIVEELHATAANSAPDAKANFSFEQLDCFSMPACNEFAKNHLASCRALDFLVMTQGMATLQGYTPTADTCGGLDEKLTLHYWSRVLLAKRLAPMLEQSTDGRVLSVLSGGVHGPYAKYGEDPELACGNYSIKNSADAAGFYNDIMVEQLSAEHAGVTFLHAAPGFVATSWGTEMPTAVRFLVRALQNFGRSKEDCGDMMIKGLMSERYKGGGWYLLDQYGEPSAKKTALHDSAKEPVWAHTKRVIENLGSVAVPHQKL
eukprot:TRINITY_DN18800_c0_g2_i1.p1 TRINITY_DN18800_c0_g2~~TRINITY_DN18800_c0_g2_i1.p1  ORF type:complete len:346 (+),score=58.53 TRINITY_DN18800_c0_g2_i1:94-1131(+)